MSYNPAFDPQSGPREDREQGKVDAQYMEDMARTRPQYVHYNAPAQPVYYQAPVTTTPPMGGPRVENVAVPGPAVRRETRIDFVRAFDSVRWGPILAGLFTTFATLVILSLLGVAVGLTAATGNPNGGAAAAANNHASGYGNGAAIWAAISALIAFFLGGYVAARTAAFKGAHNGWINGAMVWAIPFLYYSGWLGMA